MPIFDLFSKRQKRLRGEKLDVYQYTNIDNKLRVQIVHIIRDSIGIEAAYNRSSNDAYKQIHNLLCREYGVFTLSQSSETPFSSIFDYFLKTPNNEHCFDIIELCFHVIDTHVRTSLYGFRQCTGFCQEPDDAIEELNARLRESGVGYQYESGILIRVDSQYIHAEAVKPALHVLSDEKIYKGANSEFLSAHEHYRHGRYKECFTDCLKSFESVMKAICTKRKWAYDKSDTAKTLISICLQNGLVPPYLQNQFSSMKALLESGVPTLRNKEGGHGQGVEIKNPPEHLARYTLHLTATNLLFLADCEKNMK